MSRVQVVSLVLVVMVAAFVAVLALRNPQAPMLPQDEEHARLDGSEACLECHGPDGTLPRSQNHPIGLDCHRCHGRR